MRYSAEKEKAPSIDSREENLPDLLPLVLKPNDLIQLMSVETANTSRYSHGSEKKFCKVVGVIGIGGILKASSSRCQVNAAVPGSPG
jgi:hypothetical protein